MQRNDNCSDRLKYTHHAVRAMAQNQAILLTTDALVLRAASKVNMQRKTNVHRRSCACLCVRECLRGNKNINVDILASGHAKKDRCAQAFLRLPVRPSRLTAVA